MTPEPRTTHYAPWGQTRRRHGIEIALCGVAVSPSEISSDPTCEECARILDEEARAIGELAKQELEARR